MRIRTLLMIAVAGMLNFTTANAQLEGRISSSPTVQDDTPVEFQKAREAQLKEAQKEKEKAEQFLDCSRYCGIIDRITNPRR